MFTASPWAFPCLVTPLWPSLERQTPGGTDYELPCSPRDVNRPLSSHRLLNDVCRFLPTNASLWSPICRRLFWLHLVNIVRRVLAIIFPHPHPPPPPPPPHASGLALHVCFVSCHCGYQRCHRCCWYWQTKRLLVENARKTKVLGSSFPFPTHPQHPSWTTKTIQWLLVDRVRCAFYKN